MLLSFFSKYRLKYAGQISLHSRYVAKLTTELFSGMIHLSEAHCMRRYVENQFVANKIEDFKLIFRLPSLGENGFGTPYRCVPSEYK